VIVEDYEIEELYFYEFILYNEDEWNDILEVGEIEGEEIDPEEIKEVTKNRVVRCPICSYLWSNIDEFDGLNPCEHLRFWFCEGSFTAFGNWDSNQFEMGCIANSHDIGEWFLKITSPAVDKIYRTGGFLAQYWG
jgi:hypothetical protein